MRHRLFALLILPLLAIAALASIVVVDRNADYREARRAAQVAVVAQSVAQVDEALGDEALRAAQFAGPRRAGAGVGVGEATLLGRFQAAADVTDDRLDELEALLASSTHHPDLTEAVTAVRDALGRRSDITSSMVSPLQVNDRYSLAGEQLLEALSAQATFIADPKAQQQILALISLIDSRDAHLTERLLVELALSHQRWAPGQHRAAIVAATRQDQQIAFANNYLGSSVVSAPATLVDWRSTIATSQDIPAARADDWRAISDGWLSILGFRIEAERARISEALLESERSAASDRRATIGGVGAVLAATLAITALVTYRLVRRVSIITEQAIGVAAGKLARRTHERVGGTDELGTLAIAFDEMADQIERRTRNQTTESEALEAIANGGPLDETLDRIAQLFGVDGRGDPLFRITYDDSTDDIADAEPVIVARDPSTSHALPADAEVRTALSLVATARQRAHDHERLAFQATHDHLTGLLNRRAIIARLRSLGAVDAEGQCYGVLYLDLDLFKAVNDQFGHAAGDAVLLEQASRLLAMAETVDGSVGRFGGDEFLVVIPEVTSELALLDVAERLVDLLSAPVVVETAAARGSRHLVGVSLGAALARPDVEPLQLLNDADVALYEAKKAGRGTAVVSSEELRQRSRDRDRMRYEVRQAFANDEFVVWYQPVWGEGGHSLVGLEALVRWEHPERGTIGPADFLPVVEELRMLPDLDARVFSLVCEQTMAWLDSGADLQQVHVNMSTDRLEASGLIDDVADALARTGCPPSKIVAEVTESGLMTDIRSNSNRLMALRRMGIRIAVDDFGQGYSSLAYLSDLPIDLLKIDRRFVDRIDHVEANKAIVYAVIELGHKLGLTVVAEGLERAEELDYLTEAGSELFQGFLLGRPAPVAETTGLLHGGRSRADGHPSADRRSLDSTAKGRRP